MHTLYGRQELLLDSDATPQPDCIMASNIIYVIILEATYTYTPHHGLLVTQRVLFCW